MKAIKSCLAFLFSFCAFSIEKIEPSQVIDFAPIVGNGEIILLDTTSDGTVLVGDSNGVVYFLSDQGGFSISKTLRVAEKASSMCVDKAKDFLIIGGTARIDRVHLKSGEKISLMLPIGGDVTEVSVDRSGTVIAWRQYDTLYWTEPDGDIRNKNVGCIGDCLRGNLFIDAEEKSLAWLNFIGQPIAFSFKWPGFIEIPIPVGEFSCSLDDEHVAPHCISNQVFLVKLGNIFQMTNKPIVILHNQAAGVSIHPRGKKIAVIDSFFQTYLIDYEKNTEKSPEEPECQLGETKDKIPITFHPTGNILFSVGCKKTVNVYTIRHSLSKSARSRMACKDGDS